MEPIKVMDMCMGGNNRSNNNMVYLVCKGSEGRLGLLSLQSGDSDSRTMHKNGFEEMLYSTADSVEAIEEFERYQKYQIMSGIISEVRQKYWLGRLNIGGVEGFMDLAERAESIEDFRNLVEARCAYLKRRIFEREGRAVETLYYVLYNSIDDAYRLGSIYEGGVNGIKGGQTGEEILLETTSLEEAEKLLREKQAIFEREGSASKDIYYVLHDKGRRTVRLEVISEGEKNHLIGGPETIVMETDSLEEAEGKLKEMEERLESFKSSDNKIGGKPPIVVEEEEEEEEELEE